MKQAPLIVILTVLLELAACSMPSQFSRQSPIATGFPEHPLKSKKHGPKKVTAPIPTGFDDTPISYEVAKPAPLNISVHEVNARDFFMGLVVDTKENMLVHPEVTGTISLELKNVTVEQVLRAVQKMYGYDYKKNDVGYFIYPATMQTKLFKINRLDMLRTGKSNTRVSIGQTQNASQSNNNNFNAVTPIQPDADSHTSGTTLTTTSDTDFWQELEDSIRSILALDKQATVTINRQSGVVVIRAKPMQIREVEGFLSATQNQISRQVILEAKILEVILNDSHQAGINWESLVREGINKAPLITGIGTLGVAAVSSGNVFSIGGTAGDFRAFVELLETQGKTNTLSSPRISTLNNQKAVIKVGQEEYFITKISTTTVSNVSSSSIVNPNVTFTPFFSGIALDVTPQIDDEESITLHIHPSITNVTSQQKTFTINGQPGNVPMALNVVRESDSIVKAQNGQVIVLGGLMQESTVDNKEGIAGLTEIPYIGNLFRVNKNTTQKSELIILLKSTVVNADTDADWQNTINTNKQHYNNLNNTPRWQ